MACEVTGADHRLDYWSGETEVGDKQVIIRSILIGGGLTLALAASATAQTDTSQAGMAQSSQMLSRTPPPSMAPPDPSAPMTTPQYIMAASQSDEFEMQEGRMAENQAKSVKLRKFGAMMVKDHAKTTDTLHQAIISTGMSVPPPPPMRPDQMQMVAELQQLNGAAFDKAYMMQQMQSHQAALMVQSNYASNGDVPAIRGAASKAVPIVQAHIAMLNQIQNMMSQ